MLPNPNQNPGLSIENPILNFCVGVFFKLVLEQDEANMVLNEKSTKNWKIRGLIYVDTVRIK